MLDVLLHIGTVMGDVNQLKADVQSIVKDHGKKFDDWEKLLLEICAILEQGLFQVPGLNAEQLKAVVAGIRQGLAEIAAQPSK